MSVASDRPAPAPVLWITGRPASGKSTLAAALVERLDGCGVPAALVDSDEVRRHVTPEPTYRREERAQLYRSLAYLAARLAEHGIVAVVAATAHERAFRDWAREICPGLRLVYAECPLETCRERDPKGLYAAAMGDPNSRLPGIGVPFEPPADADLVVDTSEPVLPARLAELLRAAGCEA
jgi:adenylylsulfate kinase